MSPRQILVLLVGALVTVSACAPVSTGTSAEPRAPAATTSTPDPDDLTPTPAEASPSPTSPPRVVTSPVPTSPVPTSPSETASPTASPTPITSPTAQPDPTDAPPPAVPARYEPAESENHPNAKRLAAGVAHTLTNYDPGMSVDAVLAAVTSDAKRQEALAAVAEPLLRPDVWSRGTVVYPQLGGLHIGSASVMVVVRQELGRDADVVETATRTLDVRLRLVDGRWVFDQLASVGGAPPADRADLSPTARRVLDDPRIRLPDSARWDIQRGAISPRLLQVMSDLADRTPYAVVTLSSGHPFHVFGTQRQSKHTLGRAMDVYLLEDDHLVDLRSEDSVAHELVRWLYTHPEVSSIGSPWALDERGGRSFSDAVHQDHIHIAVHPESGPEPSPDAAEAAAG